MKKHSGTILLVLIFFVGLAVMLYPTISDYINQRNQTRVVNSYAQQVDGLSDADEAAADDPIAPAREREAQFLASARFAEQLAQHHIQLVKGSTLFSPTT